jgi:hypothetical protein
VKILSAPVAPVVPIVSVVVSSVIRFSAVTAPKAAVRTAAEPTLDYNHNRRSYNSEQNKIRVKQQKYTYCHRDYKPKHINITPNILLFY